MRLFWAALLLAVAGAATAQAPQGEPRAGTALKDKEFGVTTRQFALQRRVEMYQWQREGDGYGKAWSDEPIASTGFDAQHANPGAFPVETRFWVSEDVSLDGKPVHEDVLKELGAWRDFRPGFTALPGNLSATFQPEGDGLSSAENPLAPRIGDLRITWREMRLPDLEGKVVLSQGRWVLDQARLANAAPIDTKGLAAETAATDAPEVAKISKLLVAGIVVVVVLLLLVLGLRRRRRNR